MCGIRGNVVRIDFSMRSTALVTSSAESVLRNSISNANRTVSDPKYMVSGRPASSTAGSALSNSRILSTVDLRTPLTTKGPLDSFASTTAVLVRTKPRAMDPQASNTVVLRICDSNSPKKAIKIPRRAAESSNSTAKVVGSLLRCTAGRMSRSFLMLLEIPCSRRAKSSL